MPTETEAISRPACTPPRTSQAGVDAVRGDRRVPVAHQVGGREAQLPAALIAAYDDAGHPVRPAQRGGRGPHVPGVDTTADVRGTEHHAVLGDQRRLLDGETERPSEPLEQGHVAGRAMPEPEVVADHHDRRVQRLDQHVVHERLGAELGERRGERDHAERVHAQLLDQFGLAHRLGQHRRVRAGPDHLGRVRVEGDHHRLEPEIAGALHRMADDRLVAAMNAVEDADRDHRAAPAAGHRLVPPPPLHRGPPLRSGRSFDGSAPSVSVCKAA